jgi:hypothetical protein
MAGFNVRHIYSNSVEGRKKAIRNLQFALEDSQTWYLSCEYKVGTSGPGIMNFNQWIILATFDDACYAIAHATKEIKFYQMPLQEVGDSELASITR